MNKILFSLVFWAMAHSLHATTWYVATNGNDNNAGTLANPFKTLPTAIEAANPGDEILLRGGNYTSQEIRVNKNNLHIRSYPGEWAVITAVTNIEDVSSCIWYNEPETIGGTLERLELVGGYYYAIKFETNWDWDNSIPFAQRRGVSQVTVKDCIIHHSGRDGIKLTPACANISILNCEIHHTGVGPGAQLDFNAEGIDNVNAPNLTVRGCYFHDIATTGVYVKGGGRNCVIEQNRIINCGEGGIYLGFYTDADWFDTDFNPDYYENINGLVRNNVIQNTQHAGIGLWGAKDAQVYNNTVVNAAQTEHAALFFNTTDVWLDDNNSARIGSTNVRVQNNIFVQSGNQSNAMVRVRENALVGTTNVINNNSYFDPNGAVFLEDNLDWEEWPLATWRAQTGRDLNSLETEPGLDETLHLMANSPCINVGANLSQVTLDVDGHQRTDGLTDIGADEYGTTSGVWYPSVRPDLAVQLLQNPVPAGQPLQVHITTTQSQTLPVRLYAAQGQLYWNGEIAAQSGQQPYTLLPQLPKGVWVLWVGGVPNWVVVE